MGKSNPETTNSAFNLGSCIILDPSSVFFSDDLPFTSCIKIPSKFMRIFAILINKIINTVYIFLINFTKNKRN